MARSWQGTRRFFIFRGLSQVSSFKHVLCRKMRNTLVYLSELGKSLMDNDSMRVKYKKTYYV